MNCKQGDLVRYIGPNPLDRPNVFGWVGRVIKSIHYWDEPVWEVFPPLPGGLKTKGSNWSNGKLLADSVLRPIRDPGEDARDETLEWLPVPSKQKETA